MYQLFINEVLVTQLCLTLRPHGPHVHEFFRQEYWSGLPFPFPWDLPDPGIEPRSDALQVDSLLSELLGKLPTPTPIHTHTHTHTHTHSLTHSLFSIMVYHRMLNIVPCAI